MSGLLLLESFSVIMGLLFIILLIRENIWCWLFGILSSTGFAFLMFNSRLYSETILYVFYVFVGFYGFYKWKDRGQNKIIITRTKLINILMLFGLGVVLTFGVGYYFDINTNAERPFADAFTSVFSVLASFMEAHKWLSSWIFWIVINAFSIWLYFDRDLNISSFLMVIYFLLSIFGFIQWRNNYLNQDHHSVLT